MLICVCFLCKRSRCFALVRVSASPQSAAVPGSFFSPPMLVPLCAVVQLHSTQRAVSNCTEKCLYSSYSCHELRPSVQAVGSWQVVSTTVVEVAFTHRLRSHLAAAPMFFLMVLREFGCCCCCCCSCESTVCVALGSSSFCIGGACVARQHPRRGIRGGMVSGLLPLFQQLLVYPVYFALGVCLLFFWTVRSFS